MLTRPDFVHPQQQYRVSELATSVGRFSAEIGLANRQVGPAELTPVLTSWDIMGHTKRRVELSILPAAPLLRRFVFDGVIVVAEYGDHDGSYSACKSRIKHRAGPTPGAGSPVVCRKA